MKTKRQMFDLCFYSKLSFDKFLRLNPVLNDTAQIFDDRGWHFIIYVKDAPWRLGPLMKGSKQIGYLRIAGDEMKCRLNARTN